MHYTLEKMYGLQEQVIIITGASNGIGREVALGLAQLGAQVVALGRSDTHLAQTRVAFEQQGLTGSFYLADVCDLQALEHIAAEVMTNYGCIDGLVNAAGITHVQNLLDFDMADFRRVIEVNLIGTVNCCQVFGRSMVEQTQGRIVNISSVRGLQGKANHSAYAASKGAVNTFTKSLAVELAPHHVNVNAIAPIFTVTDINRDALKDPVLYNWVMSRLPKGRLGETDDLVGPVAFLLAPCSRFITGEIIYVDGGWTAA